MRSVVDKLRTPPSGVRHDYMSIGPYWWPNPASADGLPYVRRDGEVNPERSNGSFDHRPINEMMGTFTCSRSPRTNSMIRALPKRRRRGCGTGSSIPQRG